MSSEFALLTPTLAMLRQVTQHHNHAQRHLHSNCLYTFLNSPQPHFELRLLPQQIHPRLLHPYHILYQLPIKPPHQLRQNNPHLQIRQIDPRTHPRPQLERLRRLFIIVISAPFQPSPGLSSSISSSTVDPSWCSKNLCLPLCRRGSRRRRWLRRGNHEGDRRIRGGKMRRPSSMTPWR